MRISDWSSDVCSSDLLRIGGGLAVRLDARRPGSGDELLGRRQAAVEVERGDYRFADVGKKARVGAALLLVLAHGHPHEAAKAEVIGARGKGFLSYQIVQRAGQKALRRPRKHPTPAKS